MAAKVILLFYGVNYSRCILEKENLNLKIKEFKLPESPVKLVFNHHLIGLDLAGYVFFRNIMNIPLFVNPDFSIYFYNVFAVMQICGSKKIFQLNIQN